MSTYVVYGLLAIRFDKDTLKDAAPKAWQYEFNHEDRYALLDLGGPDNVTEPHPRTGREVTTRNWSAVSFGKKWEVMHDAVRLSADCESGILRMSGRPETQAEDYIKAARRAVADALSPGQASGHGITVSTVLSIPDPGSVSDCEAARVARAMDDFDGVDKIRTDDFRYRAFALSPLRHPRDAVLLMLYGNEYGGGGRGVRNTITEGPQFKHENEALFGLMAGKKPIRQAVLFLDDVDDADFRP